MASLSYIQNSDGSNRSYFPYNPLYFELTTLNVEDYTWKSPLTYDDNDKLIPSETIRDTAGGTIIDATLTVSSTKNGKQNFIDASFRDDLFDRYLSGEEQTVYHARLNKSYTGLLQMPKFSAVNIPKDSYQYTLELKITQAS